MKTGKNMKINITLIPPGLYDSGDGEWQEICKDISKELNFALDRKYPMVKFEPKKVKYEKSGEWFEIYNKLILQLGGVAGLGAVLRFIINKLVDIHKQRSETKRAKKMILKIGENYLIFEAFNKKEINRLIEKIISLMNSEFLNEDKNVE